MRLGIYGGTFDPIHNAHLIIAQFVKEELNLDEILFIPSGTPPHKAVFAPAALRLEMVMRAIADNPVFSVSELEVNKEEVSYTVETIAAVQQAYQASLHLVIGSDNFVNLHQWRDPGKILQLCDVAVFPRNGVDARHAQQIYRNEAHILTSAPQIDISSTLIRDLVRGGRSIQYLVPKPVEEIIISNHLYR